MTRSRKKDGLESKVFRFGNMLKSDRENDKYLPICNFHSHYGIILDENVCFIRNCNHYKRVYIETGINVKEAKKYGRE
jgi:hypothetical protein